MPSLGARAFWQSIIVAVACPFAATCQAGPICSTSARAFVSPVVAVRQPAMSNAGCRRAPAKKHVHRRIPSLRIKATSGDVVEDAEWEKWSARFAGQFVVKSGTATGTSRKAFLESDKITTEGKVCLSVVHVSLCVGDLTNVPLRIRQKRMRSYSSIYTHTMHRQHWCAWIGACSCQPLWLAPAIILIRQCHSQPSFWPPPSPTLALACLLPATAGG